MLSYWEQDLFKKKYDFLIVGAGFSGLWLAFFLKQKNKNLRIAILERGTLPMGASTKNAGFACFGSPSEILENAKELGWEKTLEWTQKRFEGIGIIKENFGKLIDYNPCGASEMFFNTESFNESFEKIEFLNQQLSDIVKTKNHFFVDKNIIGDCQFSGFSNAISNDPEAAIHSGKLFLYLYQRLIGEGVHIFFGTEVTDLDVENAKVKTAQLGDFEAHHLSICTNAFTSKILPKYKIAPGRGQVLITKPIVGLNWNKTFHFDRGYYYFRNVGNRVLFGGGRNLDYEGETNENFELNQNIQQNLEEILAKNILPKFNYEIEQRWAGIMAFNESKIPISEIINDKCSANVCMNGMGVALAPSLGKLLADKIA